MAPPTHHEFEGSDDFRDDERRNLVRLLSLIAERQLVGRWNPDAGNAGHQRAERIFSAGTMRAWVPMLRDVIAQVLQLYDAADRDRVLFRAMTDQQWGLIEGRVDRLFLHKIWDDASPDVIAQLKNQRCRAIAELPHQSRPDGQLDSRGRGFVERVPDLCRVEEPR